MELNKSNNRRGINSVVVRNKELRSRGGTGKLDSAKTLQAVSDIITWIVDGASFEEIAELIRSQYPKIKLTDDNIRKLCTKARKFLIKKTQQDAMITIPSHVEKYETIYNWFQNGLGNDTNTALKILKGKEKMLGLIRDSVTFVNNRNINITTTQVERKYDTSKLTNEEKLELDNLLNKIK